MVVPLRRPTADSRAITQAVLAGLQAIYQTGFRYAKAGVMLLDLSDAAVEQAELALEEEDAGRDQSRLMQALDAVNGRYGRGALLVASAGLDGDRRAWSMRQERRTPGYTTQRAELAVART